MFIATNYRFSLNISIYVLTYSELSSMNWIIYIYGINLLIRLIAQSHDFLKLWQSHMVQAV